jgi:hypothetical protein
MTMISRYYGISFANLLLLSGPVSTEDNPFSAETKRIGISRPGSSLHSGGRSHCVRKEGCMTDSTTQTGNRREYSRIDVYIPFKCRLLDKEEHGLVRSRISADLMLTDFKLMPLLANHPQIESLKLLNKKLDMIIKTVGLQSEGFHSLPFKYVSLSGNGMGFPSQQGYSLGDILECKMIMTLHHFAAICTYGEVVRVGSQGNGYFINVRFTAIDHAIQNKIVRFVFETEREMIRQRKMND